MSENGGRGGVARYAQARGFVPRQVAGETLLVPVSNPSSAPATRAADLFVLNETGSFLWDILTVPRTAEELVQELLSKYDLEIEMAREDVGAYLHALLAVGAIQQNGVVDG